MKEGTKAIAGLQPAKSNDVQSAGQVRAALRGLDPLSQEVLTQRYGFRGGVPKSIEAIAAAAGCSPGEVKEAEANALRSLMRIPSRVH